MNAHPTTQAAQALASTMDEDEREAFARNLEDAGSRALAHAVRVARRHPLPMGVRIAEGVQ